MSADKHTPGPWKADGYHVRQSGQRGTRMIADVCYTGPHHTPPEEYPASCRIVDIANANLIAAAPDLLSVCQALLVRAYAAKRLSKVDMTVLEHVIYKTKGGQP